MTEMLLVGGGMISIGGITFATKQSCRIYIQQMVVRYKDNQALSPADSRFMDAFLNRHSECELKRGAGVRRWSIRTTEYRNRCFWIERVDGTFTDVSWTHCLSPRSDFHSVCAAARTAVADDIRQFKVDAITRHPFCAVTGERVTIHTSHVDHVVPFVDLVRRFVGEELPAVSDTTDGDVKTVFKEQKVAAAFLRFHRTEAKLRLLSAAANLSRAGAP